MVESRWRSLSERLASSHASWFCWCWRWAGVRLGSVDAAVPSCAGWAVGGEPATRVEDDDDEAPPRLRMPLGRVADECDGVRCGAGGAGSTSMAAVGRVRGAEGERESVTPPEEREPMHLASRCVQGIPSCRKLLDIF